MPPLQNRHKHNTSSTANTYTQCCHPWICGQTPWRWPSCWHNGVTTWPQHKPWDNRFTSMLQKVVSRQHTIAENWWHISTQKPPNVGSSSAISEPIIAGLVSARGLPNPMKLGNQLHRPTQTG